MPPRPELTRRGPCREGGTVLVMTAILMLGLFLAVGLALDIGRIYMIRTELHNAADAAALAGVLEFNRDETGIRRAVTRARAVANNYGFQRASISIPTVEFAVNLDGPYYTPDDAEDRANTIRFIRVTTQTTPVSIVFSSSVLGGSHNETAQAVAGMSVGINAICDFFPVAVALNSAVEPGDDTDGYPMPGFNMTLNFVQGSGNSATLRDKDYIVLEVPDINGNGAPETAVLSAGNTSVCKSLNQLIDFHMTPSANVNNGPRQIADGTNTRFGEYAGGYGNQLNADNYPPDYDVRQTIDYQTYTASRPSTGSAPIRRVLITPIVDPNDNDPATPIGPAYSPPRAPIKKWAAFFLKEVLTVDNPCSSAVSGCARMQVEWIDETLVLGTGFYDPYTPETSLTIPVLYK